MRTPIAALAMLLCASANAATPIPSAASGVYAGTDRVCRVELARYQTHWITLDLMCIEFAGRVTYSLTTLYAPGQCWNSSVTVPFNPQAWSEFLALRSFNPATGALSVVIGIDQTSVANGFGRSETWTRIAPVQSPRPYTCGGAAVGNKPRG
jgi:hypothetical protein